MRNEISITFCFHGLQFLKRIKKSLKIFAMIGMYELVDFLMVNSILLIEALIGSKRNSSKY